MSVPGLVGHCDKGFGHLYPEIEALIRPDNTGHSVAATALPISPCRCPGLGSCCLGRHRAGERARRPYLRAT